MKVLINKIKFSIVIPTRNRAQDLDNCLKSIKGQTFQNYEVIIVDDNSTDNTKEISKKFNTRYIYHKERTGQSIGKNDGAKAAKGEILVFIDDDCVADNNWLENILQAFNSSRSIAIVGGKIINLGKHNVINLHSLPLWPILFPHRNETGRLLFFGIITTNFEKEHTQYVDWVSATNMAIKKDIFQKVKGFDSNFFGHCAFEEPDICSRIKNLNFEILFQPSAICIHKRSPKARKSQGLIRYYLKSNEVYFHLKYLSLDHSINRISNFLLFIIYHCWDILILSLGLSRSQYCLDDIKGKINGFKRTKLLILK